MKTKYARILAVILIISVIMLIIAAAVWIRFHTYRIYGGLTGELKDSDFYDDMESGRSFCFVGDSITRGTMTDHIGWYEPLRKYIRGDVTHVSNGEWTTVSLIENLDSFPVSDIYVFAIGINDVLKYKDTENAAVTPEDYIENLQIITDRLLTISPNAKMYFITPWAVVDQSEIINERRALYGEALDEWCNGITTICIDTYPAIMEVIGKHGADGFYMYDGIHPDIPDGVGLYSYSVLKQEHLRRAAR